MPREVQPSLTERQIDAVRAVLATTVGTQRWDRDEREALAQRIVEALNSDLSGGRGVETEPSGSVDTIHKSARRVATNVPGLGRDRGGAGGESGLRPTPQKGWRLMTTHFCARFAGSRVA